MPVLETSALSHYRPVAFESDLCVIVPPPCRPAAAIAAELFVEFDLDGGVHKAVGFECLGDGIFDGAVGVGIKAVCNHNLDVSTWCSPSRDQRC